MSIGSTIKRMRREHDMTQEQLAEYLGITANAVSQWERDRTAPDISQLPILANVFEVTTDHLLGVDITDKQAAIDRIHNEAWNLCNAGEKEMAAQTIRTALINYPNNFRLMFDIVIFLYQRAFQQKCSKEEHYSICSEAASYIDKIMAGCNDTKIKFDTIELACSIFPALGRYDDAVRLISDMSDTSKDEMLMALYSGNELIEHIKNVICKSVSTAADQTIWLASINNNEGKALFDEDSKIALYEKAISFYKTLYEKGDFFFDAESLAEAEKHIANIFASRKESEKVLFHLGECVKYVELFDTYDEKTDTYTSLIPAGRKNVGINWNNKWNKSHEMLMRLNDDPDYDFIRDNSEFKNLIKQLKQTDNTL